MGSFWPARIRLSASNGPYEAGKFLISRCSAFMCTIHTIILRYQGHVIVISKWLSADDVLVFALCMRKTFRFAAAA